MQLVKSSGEVERFNSKKIYNSIRKAGGSGKIANSAVKAVRAKFHPGIQSSEILEIILDHLKDEPGVAQRYDLKRAVMALGPSGFPFERYFARILEYYGYKTTLDNKLHGKRIIQEVDIVAKKPGEKWMVECKYHNQTGTISRLHPAMYTYARFLDLGKYKFTRPWLVTNTKCSHDAVAYAEGVGERVTSWNYPKEESLLRLIDDKKIYPITILKEMSPKILEKLYSLDLIVANDLLEKDISWIMKETGFNEKKVYEILGELKTILSWKIED